MRPDYCPMAGEPCQSLCDKPCSAHRLKDPTPPAAPVQEPLAFHAEVAAFKAWFDSWWLGDGEQGEAIPGQSDPKFKSYIDQYTLAFGAWMAAKAAAQQKPHLDLKNAVRQ